MKTTTSKDGTRLAYEQLGSGPALVLVDGAMCRRAFGPMAELAARLAPHFTVYHNDRRGRGDSGDTPPYAVEREVEDLAAIVEAAGGSACLYGASSGAMLALRAAAAGVRVPRMVLFEPPFAGEDTPPLPERYRARIDELLAAGDRGGAVALFMKTVGVPSFGVLMMRAMPWIFSKLKAVAHTLPYDFAVLGDDPGHALPPEHLALMRSVRTPTLMVLGAKSPPWMRTAVETVASAIPGAKLRVLAGQDHRAAAKAIAPVIEEFCS